MAISRCVNGMNDLAVGEFHILMNFIHACDIEKYK